MSGLRATESVDDDWGWVLMDWGVASHLLRGSRRRAKWRIGRRKLCRGEGEMMCISRKRQLSLCVSSPSVVASSYSYNVKNAVKDMQMLDSRKVDNLHRDARFRRFGNITLPCMFHYCTPYCSLQKTRKHHHGYVVSLCLMGALYDD